MIETLRLRVKNPGILDHSKLVGQKSRNHIPTQQLEFRGSSRSTFINFSQLNSFHQAGRSTPIQKEETRETEKGMDGCVFQYGEAFVLRFFATDALNPKFPFNST